MDDNDICLCFARTKKDERNSSHIVFIYYTLPSALWTGPRSEKIFLFCYKFQLFRASLRSLNR